MIQTCKNKDCKHEFQDKEYGQGKRVMNAIVKKASSPNNVRCTVCSNEQVQTKN